MNKEKTDAKIGITDYMDNAKAFFDETVKAMPDVPDLDKRKMYQLSAQRYNQTVSHLRTLTADKTETERLLSKMHARESVKESLEHVEKIINEIFNASNFLHKHIDPDYYEPNLKKLFDMILADIDTIRVSD